jgi:uncharacterized protein
MERRGMLAALMSAAALLPGLGAARAAAPARRPRLAIQVSSNDAAIMNLALNNASNVVEYYKGRGEKAAVEIVAYGPGLHMLRADTSPVMPRLAKAKETLPEVTFSACANTLRGMEKAEGKTIAIVPEARIVPAGVVRLMELEQQGWSYVRP